MVSHMPVFWFYNRFIKRDFVRRGKFCFHFRSALASVVDIGNLKSSARVACKPCFALFAERVPTTKSEHRL